MLQTQLQFFRISIDLILLYNGVTTPRSDLSLASKLWKGATCPPALLPYPGLAESCLLILFRFSSLTTYMSVTASWHLHSINVYKIRYSNTTTRVDESLKVYTNQM